MRLGDLVGFAGRTVLAHRVRSALVLLAMASGVASVIALTALGEGARRYVAGEFSRLGTHLVIVLPGRSETTGGPPPLFGETPRDLTLGDALAVARDPAIRRAVPVVVGSAPVSYRSREREVVTIGTTAEFLVVRQLRMGRGRFLPKGDPRRASPVCVLGATLERELFANQSAIGRWVRIGDRRFQVRGVLGTEGRSLGVDLDDMVIVPVASAQALFNTEGLFRLLAQAPSKEGIERAKRRIRSIIRERHEGEDDVTVITQDAVMATFDKIFRALTMTVGGIAAISLAVAGILIMNVMLVSVAQRTPEIGLLKALGAPRRIILALFLTEAIVLSLIGAVAGVLIGESAVRLVVGLYPALPMASPAWAVAAAVLVATATGLVFGVLPARRAAALDPVTALARG